MTIATEVETAATQLAGKSPQEIITWALNKFHPQISLASSFGAEDVVLIDMLAKIRPMPACLPWIRGDCPPKPMM
jgi:phosphoadenosine phosphosulfate reductase